MSEKSTKPGPRKPDSEPITVWLDYDKGWGVDHDGRVVHPILGGRRKNPKMIDLIETARHHHAQRLMLTGNIPTDPKVWLLQDMPGWTDTGSYFSAPGMGRLRHDETSTALIVATVREWLPEGDTPLNPRQAQEAFATLTDVVAAAINRDWPLMRLPGQTGINIWKLKMTDTSYGMEFMDPEIGHLIQATDPQHRIVHFVDDGQGKCDCCLPLIPQGHKLSGFSYSDGRFMYGGAGDLAEMGAAPAYRLTAAEATELQNTTPFHPARYRVRFTVPDFWLDSIGPGLFGVQDPDGRSWHWPNRPGSTWETWADAREVDLARQWTWPVEILEGIKFTKTNSLRPFTRVVHKMLDLAAEWTIDGQPISAARKDVVARAIRHMYRVTIGMFSTRPREITKVANSLDEIPDEVGAGVERLGDKYVYRVRSEKQVSDPGGWHPEIAALLWGHARTLVMQTPTALKEYGRVAKKGALEVERGQLIAINGDAIYTEHVPRWALPTRFDGGGDDGKIGRIRCKGYLRGPMIAPANRPERIKMSQAAERAGLPENLR